MELRCDRVGAYASRKQHDRIFKDRVGILPLEVRAPRIKSVVWLCALSWGGCAPTQEVIEVPQDVDYVAIIDLRRPELNTGLLPIEEALSLVWDESADRLVLGYSRAQLVGVSEENLERALLVEPDTCDARLPEPAWTHSGADESPQLPALSAGWVKEVCESGPSALECYPCLDVPPCVDAERQARTVNLNDYEPERGDDSTLRAVSWHKPGEAMISPSSLRMISAVDIEGGPPQMLGEGGSSSMVNDLQGNGFAAIGRSVSRFSPQLGPRTNFPSAVRVASGRDGSIYAYEWETGGGIYEITASSSIAEAVPDVPEGVWVLAVRDRGELAMLTEAGQLFVRKLGQWTETRARFEGTQGVNGVWEVQMAHLGEDVIVSVRGLLPQVWNIEREEMSELPWALPGRARAVVPIQGGVAVGGTGGSIRLYRGDEICFVEPTGFESELNINEMVVSPDGRELFAVTDEPLAASNSSSPELIRVTLP